MNIEIHPCFFLISLTVSLLCLALSITYKIISASNISQVREDSVKSKVVQSSVRINECVDKNSQFVDKFSQHFFLRPGHLDALKT